MLVLDRTMIIVSVALTALVLLFLNRKIWKLQQEMRLLFCVPLVLIILHIAIMDVDVCLAGLYIGVLLVAGCFFFEKYSVRKRCCVIAIVCMLLTMIPCYTSPQYRKTNYQKEFEEGFQMMKEHYVLSEYKEIQWDELYEQYVVQFGQADEEKSCELAYAAWRDFTEEFHDAHVGVSFSEENDAYGKKYAEEKSGFDYGFSLVTMENGNTVFANVKEESQAYQQGIRDGMVVVTFDGEDIRQKKAASDMWFDVFPDKGNEEFYRSLGVTCSGGETICLTYLDGEGKEQSAEISQQGNGLEQFKETKQMLAGNNEMTNLKCEMISDDTAYLVINNMLVNADVKDKESDQDAEHYSGIKKMLGAQIKEMKEDGATELIIDLRGNPGGYLEMSVALASLFTAEESFAAAEGVYNEDNGKYEIVDSVNLTAEDVWGDGEIVILVNSDTASAAELFAYFMSQKKNVTIMGMTKSAGSVMATSSYYIDTFELRFPIMLLLDENGEVLIDSGASGINRAPIDVQIPLDEKAFAAIFGGKEDYVLQYAIDYLGD